MTEFDHEFLKYIFISSGYTLNISSSRCWDAVKKIDSELQYCFSTERKNLENDIKLTIGKTTPKYQLCQLLSTTKELSTFCLNPFEHLERSLLKYYKKMEVQQSL